MAEFSLSRIRYLVSRILGLLFAAIFLYSLYLVFVTPQSSYPHYMEMGDIAHEMFEARGKGESFSCPDWIAITEWRYGIDAELRLCLTDKRNLRFAVAIDEKNLWWLQRGRWLVWVWNYDSASADCFGPIPSFVTERVPPSQGSTVVKETPD